MARVGKTPYFLIAENAVDINLNLLLIPTLIITRKFESEPKYAKQAYFVSLVN